ncbi:hypothetical protein [Paenibacillus taichungensis]|uniref:Uncharacterized protein n=2 Tax=Paenibacillus pabuli TaxID=1472 RepID=A0A855YHY9_9BACL|nr:hypothetical protein [Paenibacillus taichungensis]PWW44090.1 hypothetical protein DET56_102322 [Paenibacillus pabuli]PXW10119.1 hypothetical protein DEU73_102322 [Paenibacillus taichungensis]RAI91317.1 hypothetical protein DET54_112183 [Paenibacillus pabuli]
MTQMIKAKDDTLTEELVASLIGKCVHAPTNVHEIQTPTGATTKANVWILTSAFELEIHELTQEEFAQLIEEKKKEENTTESHSALQIDKVSNEQTNPELLIGNE